MCVITPNEAKRQIADIKKPAKAGFFRFALKSSIY